MNHHFGKNTQTGKSYYFEVEVGPKPETFESYMKRVFAGVGLKSDYSIKAFDNFMGGQSFFREMVNNAKSNSAVAGALQNPQGKISKVTVHVYPPIVEKLRRFGINLAINHQGKATFTGHAASFSGNVKKYQNFTPAPETPVSQWTTIQKLDSVIRRAALLLPEEVGNELLNLIKPWSLAIMAALLVFWVIGHFFVASEIADVALLIVGGAFLGFAAFQAGEHLGNFAVKCINGKTEKDLDESAQHLAEAIALIGVQTVMALLLAKAPKVFREPKVLMNQSKLSVPLTMKTVGKPPVTEGEFFYKLPEIKVWEKHPYAETNVPGRTSQWGETTIFPGRNSTPKDIEIAKFHEEVHRFLTPKFQVFKKLRQARAVLKTNSYLKSYLLRYIEEALAETIAQVKGNGWRNFFQGVKYPIGNESYVTIVMMGVEATGILLGPINVGGMVFNVYFSYTKDW